MKLIFAFLDGQHVIVIKQKVFYIYIPYSYGSALVYVLYLYVLEQEHTHTHTYIYNATKSDIVRYNRRSTIVKSYALSS